MASRRATLPSTRIVVKFSMLVARLFVQPARAGTTRPEGHVPAVLRPRARYSISRPSEFQTQHKLQAPRQAGPDGSGVQWVGDDSKARGGREIARRIGKDGVIEQVESLRPELQVHLFRKARPLLQGGVHLPHAGAARDVASQISPGVFGRDRKRGWIEPVVDRLVDRVDRYAGDQVRPLVRGISVQHGRGTAGNGDIDRPAGAGGRDTAE